MLYLAEALAQAGSMRRAFPVAQKMLNYCNPVAFLI